MKKYNKKWFLGMVMLCMAIFTVGCSEELEGNRDITPTSVTLGDTFEFDNLEITIKDEVSWTIMEDYPEHEVFYFPVTIKNLMETEHDLVTFYYAFFTPEGTLADCINEVFNGSVYWTEKIPVGETVETIIYITYEEDGEYRIEFGDWENELVEVLIPIQR